MKVRFTTRHAFAVLGILIFIAVCYFASKTERNDQFSESDTQCDGNVYAGIFQQVLVVVRDGEVIFESSIWSDNSWLEWSPDGTKLAFSYKSEKTGYSKMRVFEIDTHHQYDVTSQHRYMEQEPYWSPDSTYLAITMWPAIDKNVTRTQSIVIHNTHDLSDTYRVTSQESFARPYGWVNDNHFAYVIDNQSYLYDTYVDESRNVDMQFNEVEHSLCDTPAGFSQISYAP